jgi:hypothetical protein
MPRRRDASLAAISTARTHRRVGKRRTAVLGRRRLLSLTRAEQTRLCGLEMSWSLGLPSGRNLHPWLPSSTVKPDGMVPTHSNILLALDWEPNSDRAVVAGVVI